MNCVLKNFFGDAIDFKVEEIDNVLCINREDIDIRIEYREDKEIAIAVFKDGELIDSFEFR